jgi:hypothetical protein
MVDITVSIELDQLAHDVTTNINLTDQDVVGFVKSIDDSMGDWSFTNELYRYFKKEMKRARKDGWTND